MELCVRFCAQSSLLVFALIASLAAEVLTERIAFPVPYKSITGHLHLLRECRRQLTFLASIALGAFITRIIKESPLTPLPLPPMKDPAEWSFLTLPLHVANPYAKWPRGYSQKMDKFHQDSDNSPSAWDIGRLINSIEEMSWKNRPRFRRDLSRFEKPSSSLIANAVIRTLTFLRPTLTGDIKTRHRLLRLCH